MAVDIGEAAPDFTLPATGASQPLHLYEELPKHRAAIVAFYVFDFTPG